LGKRSDFKRLDKDKYYTIDPRAVAALQPFLADREIFVEPCAGAGDLIDQLEALGHDCLYSCDIDPDGPKDMLCKDALTIDKFDVHFATSIITNPPWSRPILHQMIEHFVHLKPTWLLFDADWMHTAQAVPYLHYYCTDIVSVGRLKWIPGTTMQGKDNVCWYKFNQRKQEGILPHPYTLRFHPRIIND
jgi:hypothetical protein